MRSQGSNGDGSYNSRTSTPNSELSNGSQRHHTQQYGDVAAQPPSIDSMSSSGSSGLMMHSGGAYHLENLNDASYEFHSLPSNYTSNTNNIITSDHDHTSKIQSSSLHHPKHSSSKQLKNSTSSITPNTATSNEPPASIMLPSSNDCIDGDAPPPVQENRARSRLPLTTRCSSPCLAADFDSASHHSTTASDVLPSSIIAATATDTSEGPQQRSSFSEARPIPPKNAKPSIVLDETLKRSNNARRSSSEDAAEDTDAGMK